MVDSGVQFSRRQGSTRLVSGLPAVHRCLHPGLGLLSPTSHCGRPVVGGGILATHQYSRVKGSSAGAPTLPTPATVGVCADNTTALAYLSHQGGTHSSALNDEAQRTLRWEESKSISLRTQFISGSRNVVADSLSRRSQVLSTEWTLHHEVCRALWRLWGMSLVVLFITSQNFRLPAFVSPFPDPMAITTDAFLFTWDHQ